MTDQPNVQTSTMQAATPGPRRRLARGATQAAPSGPPQDNGAQAAAEPAAEAPKGTSRKRRSGAGKKPLKATQAELDATELQALGQITLSAHRAGLTAEEYVEHCRKVVAVWDKMTS